MKGLSIVAFVGVCLTAAVWLLVVAGGVYGLVYWYFHPKFEIRTPIDFDLKASNCSTKCIEFPNIPLESQDYAVSLELDLPRSTANLRYPNFMVDMTLYPKNPSGQEISIKRMAMLPFKSNLIETFDEIVYAPLYVFGFSSQLERLSINMFDFVDAPSSNYRCFRLALGRIDLMQQIQVARAHLVWTAKLRGFRRLMYNAPLSTCFVCVGALWFSGVLVTITVALIVNLNIQPETSIKQEPEDDPIREQLYQLAREKKLNIKHESPEPESEPRNYVRSRKKKSVSPHRKPLIISRRISSSGPMAGIAINTTANSTRTDTDSEDTRYTGIEDTGDTSIDESKNAQMYLKA